VFLRVVLVDRRLAQDEPERDELFEVGNFALRLLVPVRRPSPASARGFCVGVEVDHVAAEEVPGWEGEDVLTVALRLNRNEKMELPVPVFGDI